MSYEPLIGIGMPVYNGERHIRQALDSLLAQDYGNFELVISDNASTDETQQICLEYAERDKRIRYYRNERNMGIAWNFNRVFELSSGEYFMSACHDDWWAPNYLSSCLEALSSSESIVLAGTMCKSIAPETGKLLLIDHGVSTIGLKARERFKHYKLMLHCGKKNVGSIFCGVYKRDALRKVMPLKNMIGTDHVLLAELSLQGEFITIQENLMTKRYGGTSASHKNVAHALSVTNPMLIRCPYFVREVLMQKVIFQTDKLALPEKVTLSYWSLNNYIKVHFIPPLHRRFQTISRLPAKMVNKLLKPLGVKFTRICSQSARQDVVKLSKYKELIRQFHGCFTDSFFCDLPINKNRCDLLVKLLGTGIGEAMYILAFLHQSIKLDGDVCEFGVAQGATSALLANEVLSFDNKCLWLFDSFEGLPKPSSKDKLIDDIFNLGSIEAYQGRMCCPVESVKSRISEISFPTSRLKIVQGFIEETITGDLLPGKVCFAYVDFDFYQPILTALNFLSEHLSVGGSVIVDDYGFFSSGAKTVIDEFMAAHSHDFKMILPPDWAGHFAILVKGSRPNNGSS